MSNDRLSGFPTVPALRRTELNPHMGRPGAQIAIFRFVISDSLNKKSFVWQICYIGNRDLATRTTHVGVRFSPPECWDRGKTAQAVVGHLNLKLTFVSIYISYFWHFCDRWRGNNRFKKRRIIYFKTLGMDWGWSKYELKRPSNILRPSKSLFPLRNLGFGSLTLGYIISVTYHKYTIVYGMSQALQITLNGLPAPLWTSNFDFPMGSYWNPL